MTIIAHPAPPAATLPTLTGAGAGRIRASALAVLPTMLYALRFAASVCLALYAAFYLQLDNPTWAGTSAAATCQPILGASLRKGGFRVIGTLVGAAFIVLLTACFPQDRIAFLAGLALWGAACAFVNTILANFAAYAAALAGFTAAIIAGDALDDPTQTFALVVSRASEISLGVVAATVVVSLTSFGQARKQLGAEIAVVATATLDHLAADLAAAGGAGEDPRPARRALIGRAAALSPLVDQALGEASDVRRQQGTLQAGVDSLFGALSAWRSVSAHLRLLAPGQARSAAQAARLALPQAMRDARPGCGALRHLDDPAGTRDGCAAAAAAVAAEQAGDPSARLVLERVADGLRAAAQSFNAVALLSAPGTETSTRARSRWNLPDLLPPLVNAARVFLTIAAAEAFWVVTAWPGGTVMVTFAFVTVIQLSSLNEGAYAAALGFVAGAAGCVVLAGALKFGIQPAQQGFAAFALSLSLFLAPIAALSQAPSLKAAGGPAAFLFVPLLGVANQPSYDTAAFYNSALAIVSGCVVTAIALRLIPPVPPATRTARLLAATLHGVHRLASGCRLPRAGDWDLRVYSRLAALPDGATPTQRARLVTALAVGGDIIRLRVAAQRLCLTDQLAPALAAVARGDSMGAVRGLAAFDEALASVPASRRGGDMRLGARASICNLADALRTHAAYFGLSGPRA